MAPSKYLIDVSRLIWRLSSGRLPTGIDRVCLAYVMHYRDQAQAVIQWKRFRRILSPADSQNLFDLLLSEIPNFKRAIWLLALRSLPKLARSRPGLGRLYLNVGHTGLDQPGLSEWLKEADVKPIFMLHDLIPITHPEFCRAGSREKHIGRVNTMLTAASGIIGNSQSTLDLLADYAQQHDRAVPPTLSAWLGATPLAVSGKKLSNGAKPYFAALGTIEGRKNHLLLLKIWQKLIARHGSGAPRLVIIGQRGWESQEALTLLDTDRTLQGFVEELPRCTDTELAHHLEHARALLFPSFAEGYGMPLVEALGHGTPVIASSLEVFRELAGDIPVYLDPDDLDGWQRAIEDFSEPNSALRANQLALLKDYEMPDWAGHFVKVDSWLDAILA